MLSYKSTLICSWLLLDERAYVSLQSWLLYRGNAQIVDVHIESFWPTDLSGVCHRNGGGDRTRCMYAQPCDTQDRTVAHRSQHRAALVTRSQHIRVRNLQPWLRAELPLLVYLLHWQKHILPARTTPGCRTRSSCQSLCKRVDTRSPCMTHCCVFGSKLRTGAFLDFHCLSNRG